MVQNFIFFPLRIFSFITLDDWSFCKIGSYELRSNRSSGLSVEIKYRISYLVSFSDYGREFLRPAKHLFGHGRRLCEFDSVILHRSDTAHETVRLNDTTSLLRKTDGVFNDFAAFFLTLREEMKAENRLYF